MKYTKARGAFALACTMGLAACGGDPSAISTTDPGGGGNPPPPPGTALQVTGSTPGDLAAGVARTVQPAITFNDALDAASLNTDSVQLLGPTGVPVPAEATATGNTLRLRPLAGWLPGEASYTVRLAESLRGAAGGKLGQPFTTRFTTAAQQWQATQAVPGRLSSIHALAVDSAGAATLVWPDNNNGSGYLRASRWTGSEWTATELVVPAITGSITETVGVTERDGRVTVAWQQFGADAGVFSASYRDGAWSAPHRLSTQAGTQLRIATNHAGAAALVWIEVASGSNRRLMGAMLGGAGWAEPLTLATDVGFQAPNVAVDPTGQATAIWTQFTSAATGGYRVFSGPLAAGATPQRLSRDGTSLNELPAIVADASGTLTAAWLETQAGGLAKLAVARGTGGVGGTWGPVEILDGGRTLFNRPALVADAADRVTVLWNAVANGTYIISSARYADGAWSAPSDVPGSGPNEQPIEPAAVVDAAGRITVAWSVVASGNYRVLYTRGGVGAWTQADWLGDGDGASTRDSNPMLGLDAGGNLTAAWIRSQGASASLRARRFE
jgi:hypothetical protein